MQDNPIDSLKDEQQPEAEVVERILNKRSTLEIPMSGHNVSPIYAQSLKPESLYERRQCLNHRFTSPRILHLSPCRARPSSRNSLSSRLSSSHNSLVTQFQTDDSSFITQAISHDTLSAKTSDITDMYNVPFDSDIYAVPIDMVRPSHSNLKHKGKKNLRSNKKRVKSSSQTITQSVSQDRSHKAWKESSSTSKSKENSKTKRHSLPGSSVKKSTDSDTDSLHLTLREMRKYLHTLYSSSSDSESRNAVALVNNNDTTSKHTDKNLSGKIFAIQNSESMKNLESNNNNQKINKIKNKKNKENTCPKEVTDDKNGSKKEAPKLTPKLAKETKIKNSPVRILSITLRQSFCNLFRWRRHTPAEGTQVEEVTCSDTTAPAAVRRALPPLPQSPRTTRRAANEEEKIRDFATSIQKVKDVCIFLLIDIWLLPYFTLTIACTVIPAKPGAIMATTEKH